MILLNSMLFVKVYENCKSANDTQIIISKCFASGLVEYFIFFNYLQDIPALLFKNWTVMFFMSTHNVTQV